MAESNKKIAFFQKEISPAMRMVLFVGGAVLIIMLIILSICLFSLKPEEKTPGQTNSGLNKDFSLLIGEGNENDGFYEDFSSLDTDLGDIFALYEENKSYYHECTVTVFGKDGTKLERSKRILRDGDKYNIRTYNKNTLIETIKCDGKNVVIINETTGKQNKAPLSEFTVPMELASMPSHENLLSLLKEYGENKENSTLSDASFKLSRSRDMNILEIEIKYKDTEIAEKYLYYLNYGIIYSCESEPADGGMKAYSMNTTYFDQNITSYISDNSFTVN